VKKTTTNTAKVVGFFRREKEWSNGEALSRDNTRDADPGCFEPIGRILTQRAKKD